MFDSFLSDPFFAPMGGTMNSFGGGFGNNMMDPFSGFGGLRGPMMGNRQNANPSSSYSFSSTTTSYGGASGRGETITTQTTRRIINGREETLSERMIQKADGTIERQVLDSNGRPVAQLESNRERAAALPVSRASTKQSSSRTSIDGNRR